MANVKIVLKRSPVDPENGVWIDGVKLDGVQEVSVYGAAREIPHVVLKLVPTAIELGAEDPDIDQSREVQANYKLGK